MLELHFSAWSGLLEKLDNPVGHRFFADFGAGLREYEVSEDGEGYLGVPADVDDLGTPRRLNPTEAEFRLVDLVRVLEAIAASLESAGGIQEIGGGVYGLGRRVFSGVRVVFFATPAGLPAGLLRSVLKPMQADVTMLLVPDIMRISPRDAQDLAAMRVAITELPLAPPWQVDLSPLVENESFGVPLNEPVQFYGARYAIVVDPDQRSIWLEGRKLSIPGDGRLFRLLAYLCSRPGTYVPHGVLANQVIESSAKISLESRLVIDAKHALVKKIEATLVGVRPSRLCPKTLLVIENGCMKLNLDAGLVRVVRRPSDP